MPSLKDNQKRTTQSLPGRKEGKLMARLLEARPAAHALNTQPSLTGFQDRGRGAAERQRELLIWNDARLEQHTQWAEFNVQIKRTACFIYTS